MPRNAGRVSASGRARGDAAATPTPAPKRPGVGAPAAPRREDRRTRRTRQVLEQALLDLMEEVGYASITVQQLADRADIGRATFYQHFRDKDALLHYVVQRLIADLAARLPRATTPDLFGEDRLVVAAVFERAKAERRLYRGLCSAKGSALAIRRIQQFVAARFEERMVRPLAAEAPSPPSHATVGMLAFYVAGVLLDLLVWWLDHRCRETPEEMALLLRRLTVPGIARVLGVTTTSSETA